MWNFAWGRKTSRLLQTLQQVQVGHEDLLHWPTEFCLVWKRLLCKLCFIHRYTIENRQWMNFAVILVMWPQSQSQKTENGEVLRTLAYKNGLCQLAYQMEGALCQPCAQLEVKTSPANSIKLYPRRQRANRIGLHAADRAWVLLRSSVFTVAIYNQKSRGTACHVIAITIRIEIIRLTTLRFSFKKERTFFVSYKNCYSELEHQQ